jgi:hypothetical protein
MESVTFTTDSFFRNGESVRDIFARCERIGSLGVLDSVTLRHIETGSREGGYAATVYDATYLEKILLGQLAASGITQGMENQMEKRPEGYESPLPEY